MAYAAPPPTSPDFSSSSSRKLWLRDLHTVTDDAGPHLKMSYGPRAHTQYVFYMLFSVISVLACLLTLFVIWARRSKLSPYERIVFLTALHQLLDSVSFTMEYDPTTPQYYLSGYKYKGTVEFNTYRISYFLHDYGCIMVNALVSLLIFGSTYVILRQRTLDMNRIIWYYFAFFGLFSFSMAVAYVIVMFHRNLMVYNGVPMYSTTYRLGEIRNGFRLAGICFQTGCLGVSFAALYRSSLAGGKGSKKTSTHRALFEMVRRFSLYPIFDMICTFPYIWKTYDPFFDRTDDYTFTPAERAYWNANDCLYNSLPPLAGLCFSITYFVHNSQAWMSLLRSYHRTSRLTIQSVRTFTQRLSRRASTQNQVESSAKEQGSNQAVEVEAAKTEEEQAAAGGETEPLLRELGDEELMEAYLDMPRLEGIYGNDQEIEMDMVRNPSLTSRRDLLVSSSLRLSASSSNSHDIIPQQQP